MEGLDTLLLVLSRHLRLDAHFSPHSPPTPLYPHISRLNSLRSLLLLSSILMSSLSLSLSLDEVHLIDSLSTSSLGSVEIIEQVECLASPLIPSGCSNCASLRDCAGVRIFPNPSPPTGESHGVSQRSDAGLSSGWFAYVGKDSSLRPFDALPSVPVEKHDR
jgi:hypothetical protein